MTLDVSVDDGEWMMKLLGLDQHSAQLDVVGPSRWVCPNIIPIFHAPEQKHVLTPLQKEQKIAQTQFEKFAWLTEKDACQCLIHW